MKTNKSKRKFEVKTRYFAATAEALTKQISDSNMLKMHPKAAIKLDQTMDCLSARGRLKTSGKSIQTLENHSKKSLLDQFKEENQNNPSKRRVLNFFGILGKCCSYNNWRLLGEP